MSRRTRLVIFWTLMILGPFAMSYMHKTYGWVGLFSVCALALLMGLSYFPHVIGEDNENQ